MTLPDERLRALRAAHSFLVALITPARTKRVPASVRDWARRVLRHYPTELDIDRLGKGEVGLFAESTAQRNR